MENDVVFDEMFQRSNQEASSLRMPYQNFHKWIGDQEPAQLRKRARMAQDIFQSVGITFNVYDDSEGVERVIPFDIIPRIFTSSEWRFLEEGIAQRVKAMNAFLYDIYHQQEIIKAGILPAQLVYKNKAFLPHMMDFDPPGKIYIHVVGVDVVRTDKDQFFVLEDNARVPSGVSYMLENRETMLHMFPELFKRNRIRSVEYYPQQLYQTLCESLDDVSDRKPIISLLTPGNYNSAYFEHSFLADEMGVELIEGSDLVFHEGDVCQRTTEGPKPIDIIYRRLDDDFLDPLNFKSDTLIGMPGLFDAYRAGKVMLANAPGSGIADDKAVYAYMPKIIEFYMGESPKLQNVKTWLCAEKDHLDYVIEHLDELVVKEVHGSGGYGMMVGPAASKRELNKFRRKLKARPSGYIAQPTLSLSTVPVLTNSGLAPRHVDFRPFALLSPRGVCITPGGLTRVAMKKNCLVVNSSQGGGTKDTWIIDDNLC